MRTLSKGEADRREIRTIPATVMNTFSGSRYGSEAQLRRLRENGLSLSRRAILAAAGTGAIVGTLGGCCLFTRPLVEFPPNDPRYTDLKTRLTIDAHTHVFNGSDLQVGAFLDLVVLSTNPKLEALGPVLQELAWDFAPNANDELQALDELRRTTAFFSADTMQQVYDRHSERAYQSGVQSLKNAVRAATQRLRINRNSLSPIATKINNLPNTYQQYKSQKFAQSITAGATMDSVIAFILRNFQYRYVNVFDYLSTYSTGTTRKIDLMVAHLVDYDWPIGWGAPTQSSLKDQMQVMDEIAILTGGRIHYFVPFDPMKEVAYRLRKNPSSSLELVREAVTGSHGMIGVKLYPPMGFAPSGNAKYDPATCKVPWIPPPLNSMTDLGKCMDIALDDLFSFCRANDVPIMAHTARSNAPCRGSYCEDTLLSTYYDRFLDPKSWLGLPKGVRVDFGHFGDTDEAINGITRARHFADLMTSNPGSEGEFFYADSAYFADILTQPQLLREKLQALFDATANKGSASLANRLMYGTDWEMITIEGGMTDRYLDRFETMFSTLDPSGALGNRFFALMLPRSSGSKLERPSTTARG